MREGKGEEEEEEKEKVGRLVLSGGRKKERISRRDSGGVL